MHAGAASGRGHAACALPSRRAAREETAPRGRTSSCAARRLRGELGTKATTAQRMEKIAIAPGKPGRYQRMFGFRTNSVKEQHDTLSNAKFACAADCGAALSATTPWATNNNTLIP